MNPDNTYYEYIQTIGIILFSLAVVFAIIKCVYAFYAYFRSVPYKDITGYILTYDESVLDEENKAYVRFRLFPQNSKSHIFDNIVLDVMSELLKDYYIYTAIGFVDFCAKAFPIENGHELGTTVIENDGFKQLNHIHVITTYIMLIHALDETQTQVFSTLCETQGILPQFLHQYLLEYKQTGRTHWRYFTRLGRLKAHSCYRLFCFKERQNIPDDFFEAFDMLKTSAENDIQIFHKEFCDDFFIVLKKDVYDLEKITKIFTDVCNSYNVELNIGEEIFGKEFFENIFHKWYRKLYIDNYTNNDLS